MSHRSRMCALLIDCPKDQVEPAVQLCSGALGRPVVAKTNSSAPYTRLETPQGEALDVALQVITAQEARLHFEQQVAQRHHSHPPPAGDRDAKQLALVSLELGEAAQTCLFH